MNYHFPGNIRELKSIIQFSVNLAQKDKVTVKCLPKHLQKGTDSNNHKKIKPRFNGLQPLETVIKSHILETYKETNKNKMQTAKYLEIGINTLRRKLRSYGVE